MIPKTENQTFGKPICVLRPIILIHNKMLGHNHIKINSISFYHHTPVLYVEFLRFF